jgi:hypothetical protein
MSVFQGLLLLLAFAFTMPVLASVVQDYRAHRRSVAVLLSVLSEVERERFIKGSGGFYLDVPSRHHRGRVYRISWPGKDPIVVLKGGIPRERLCLQPESPLPPADRILLHKLMLEGDEEGYLSSANHLSYFWGQRFHC